VSVTYATNSVVEVFINTIYSVENPFLFKYLSVQAWQAAPAGAENIGRVRLRSLKASKMKIKSRFSKKEVRILDALLF